MRVVDVETNTVRELRLSDGRVVTYEAAYADDGVEEWLLPGLVDMHNHLSLFSPAGDDADPPERVRASASLELALGVLAIREPGSPDDASRMLNDEPGWPRVVAMGRFIAPPGGYFPGLAREVVASELAGAALDEARRGGGWAKIIADFLDEAGRFRPNWAAEVLADAVAAVHDIGGRVAVHALCPEAVDAAVAARVDSIEHGWAVGREHVAAMRMAGIALVPTLVEGGAHTACEFARSVGMSDADQRWMEAALDAQPALIAYAHDAGVEVLAGTDAGQGPHGRIVSQIEMLAAAGLPTRDAIGAASWAARRYLRLACLEPGAPADFVTYPADPVVDVDVLRRPRRIVLAGRVLRQPVQTTR
jgi:imidazolonepropionase-like amidohydrolase